MLKKNIKKYKKLISFEEHDKNIKIELIKLGINDNTKIQKMVKLSKKGNLATYLNKKDKIFTFGILNAIFKDAIKSKKSSDIKIGTYKMIHRIVPMALSPFFPILAIVGYILGTTRAFNKLILPILSDPGNNYNDFLKKIIDRGIKISEGDINIKDRFSRAFIVSDDIINAIKPEVIHHFSIYLSNKMENMDSNEEVPDHFIENELKMYLNDMFNINPKIPLK